MAGKGLPPTLLSHATSGTAFPRDGSSSALRSLRTTCSRFRSGIDIPPVVPHWILTPGLDPSWRGQVRGAPGSQRVHRPRGWPLAAGREAGKNSQTGRQGGSWLSLPLAGSQRRVGDAGEPPHLWHAGVGWIYCTWRLLTHRRAGGEIAVSCFLEGSCVQNAAMAAGAITRS